jgi:hypothetical protein
VALGAVTITLLFLVRTLRKGVVLVVLVVCIALRAPLRLKVVGVVHHGDGDLLDAALDGRLAP